MDEYQSADTFLFMVHDTISYRVSLLSDTVSLRDNIELIYKREILSGALTFSSWRTTRQGLSGYRVVRTICCEGRNIKKALSHN